MPKKIIRRKSSSSRRVTARPLSFWQFIRKNFLIISGLLLLPVTVGAVVSSYNYANQGSAAGRRNVLRTQDNPIVQPYECTVPENEKGCKTLAADGNKCVPAGTCERRADNIEGYCKCSYGGKWFDCFTTEPECNAATPRYSAPPDQPEISIDVYQNCETCLYRYNYYPYDQWNPGGFDSRDYTREVDKSNDAACVSAINTKAGCTGGSPASSDTYPTVVIPNTSLAPTSPPDSSSRTNYCNRDGSNTYCKDGKVRRRSWARYKNCHPDCYTDSGCVEDGVTDVETEETCGGGPVSAVAPTSAPQASSDSCAGPDSASVCRDKRVGEKILSGYTGTTPNYLCECQRTSGNNCGCKDLRSQSAGFDMVKAIKNFFGIFGF